MRPDCLVVVSADGQNNDPGENHCPGAMQLHVQGWVSLANPLFQFDFDIVGLSNRGVSSRRQGQLHAYFALVADAAASNAPVFSGVVSFSSLLAQHAAAVLHLVSHAVRTALVANGK
jgi:hypothetical protein